MEGRRCGISRVPQPQCERCGTTDPTKRYEWANLTGHYEDVADYERMCKSCHERYDRARQPPFEIKHGTHAGWLAHGRRKEHPCEACRLARNAYAREWYRKRTSVPSDLR